MKLSEYLNQRTANGNWVKALSHTEAMVCGVPWPLVKGWPSKYADLEVDADAMRAAISARLLRRQQAKEQQRANTSELKKQIFKAARQVQRSEKRKARAFKRQLAKRKHYASTDAFLGSYEWRVVRMKILIRDGRRCVCCGATPDDGVRLNVDHIKPRSTHPELALDLDNLQVLCEVCNHGKGNWDSTDWRKKPAANDALEEEQTAHIRSIVHG